jgi:hypothetical protein
MDVAGSHRDVHDPGVAAGACRVQSIFGENDRVVIGVGDALAAHALGRGGDALGTGAGHEPVHVARFRDIPVLAELAGEIAAGGAEGEDGTARVELIERLFLDGVDAEAGTAPVGGQHHGAGVHLAHEAGAALAFVQLAVARAKVALDAAIVERVPPAAGMAGPSSWRAVDHGMALLVFFDAVARYAQVV